MSVTLWMLLCQSKLNTTEYISLTEAHGSSPFCSLGWTKCQTTTKLGQSLNTKYYFNPLIEPLAIIHHHQIPSMCTVEKVMKNYIASRCIHIEQVNNMSLLIGSALGLDVIICNEHKYKFSRTVNCEVWLVVGRHLFNVTLLLAIIFSSCGLISVVSPGLLGPNKKVMAHKCKIAILVALGYFSTLTRGKGYLCW